MTVFAEVIGDPVAQAKSPVIHGFWLEKLGLAAEYGAMRVPAEGLAAYLAVRSIEPGWRGCNVTIPHKQVVMPLVADLEDSARQVGAANIVYPGAHGLTGANSDVDGVSESLGARAAGVTCLIGAGGAARAAVFALQGAGVGELRIIVRRAESGRELLERFGIAGAVFGFDAAGAALAGAETVINASSLGMNGQPAMPDAVLGGLAGTAAGALVLDMVDAPLETQLLAAARALGRRPVDGLTMLIGQADQAFRLFFGAEAPRRFDAELRALLTI